MKTKFATLLILLLMLVSLSHQALSQTPEVRITVLKLAASSGYGLPNDKRMDALLELKLNQLGYNVSGVMIGTDSGSTAAIARQMLPSALASNPDIVILVAGGMDIYHGNFGEPGHAPNEIQPDFEYIITELQNEGVLVLLTGLYMPDRLPTYYNQYGSQLAQMYSDLTQNYNLAYYEISKDNSYAQPPHVQSGGLHFEVSGMQLLTDDMLPQVEALVNQVLGSGPSPTNTSEPPTATPTNTLEPTPTTTNTPESIATETNTPEPTATNTSSPEPTASNTPETTSPQTHSIEIVSDLAPGQYLFFDGVIEDGLMVEVTSARFEYDGSWYALSNGSGGSPLRGTATNGGTITFTSESESLQIMTARYPTVGELHIYVDGLHHASHNLNGSPQYINITVY